MLHVARGHPAMKFLLPQTASFFVIGGRKTLFSEELQQVFELDDISMYLSCRLLDCVSMEQLQDELIERGLDRTHARLRVVQALQYWSKNGLLKASIDRTKPAALPSQTILLGGLRINIRYHDQTIVDLVYPIFRHLNLAEIAADAPEEAIHYDLLRVGRFVCICNARSKQSRAAAA